MPAAHPTVVVVGASLAGLLAAPTAARAGHPVTVLERDALTGPPGPRRGVAQGAQPHVLLHRGLAEATTLLPGLGEDLLAAGAVRVDTGRLPWFGPAGWQPTDVPSYAVLSLTRPLLEHVVRERVLALPGVGLRGGCRVRGLERAGGRWRVLVEDGPDEEADLVVDASGRGSRLPTWLAALGLAVEEPETVDAGLGYASRLYRARDGHPLTNGAVVQSTTDSPRGGLALPVEDGGLLVLACGYGEHRPDRDVDLVAYLGGLREPALGELTAGLEPVGEVAVHRQTGNRRHQHGRRRDWPDGLLAVGDALCAFNPVYGQGITVAAIQARLLGEALRRRRGGSTRRLQRRLRAAADLPWAVATGEDRRYLDGTTPSPAARLVGAWTTEVGNLAVAGDRRALVALGRLYHLMGSPLELAHPALLLAAARRRRGPAQPSAPRPPELEALLTAAHG
ncbi:hypothetical protein [Microlunatus capsulatus]|uniref:NAD(P)/FAD-dependent oxidoreductase n=1 Tax=Microlunatus capsulatus TaxID=99117 RepID=UPI0031D3E558